MEELVSNHAIEPRRELGLTPERATLEPDLGKAVLSHVLEIIFVENPTAQLHLDDPFKGYPLSNGHWHGHWHAASSRLRPHNTPSCELT